MQVLSKFSKIQFSSQFVGKKDLKAFKNVQRLAYQCTIEIGRELTEGWTEKQTSSLMDVWLKDNGVRNFFHKSFAWFGDRSRFNGMKNYFDFMPSDRIFTGKEPVILDTAPILNGYPGDIGFSFSKTPNPELVRARNELLHLRAKIKNLFGSDKPASEIWKIVDDDLRENGFSNCHSRYPFAVLGHRLRRIPFSGLPGVTVPFTLHSYYSLLSHGFFPELLGPWHSGEKTGIWAIEPHLGGAGFGAKFEEILVVEKGQAHWLDDDVPHKKLPKGFY